MQIPDEIKLAASNLGINLAMSPEVIAYQNAVLAIQNDAATTALEEKHDALYQQLAAEEKAGQVLDQARLQEYYQLRDQLRQNALIAERNDQAQAVKFLFAETNQTMTTILGIDFTILAL